MITPQKKPLEKWIKDKKLGNSEYFVGLSYVIELGLNAICQYLQTGVK